LIQRNGTITAAAGGNYTLTGVATLFEVDLYNFAATLMPSGEIVDAVFITQDNIRANCSISLSECSDPRFDTFFSFILFDPVRPSLSLSPVALNECLVFGCAFCETNRTCIACITPYFTPDEEACYSKIVLSLPSLLLIILPFSSPTSL